MPAEELGVGFWYRGTSLTRNSAPTGPYSRIMHGADGPREGWWFLGGGLFLVTEVLLYLLLSTASVLTLVLRLLTSSLFGGSFDFWITKLQA